MPLVKDGRIIEDRYLRLAEGAAVPAHGAIILPASRLLADADNVLRRDGPTGVLWPNDRSVGELAPWLGGLALIGLSFPTYKDGRAYSQARILRERHGFGGELRATGQVLRDQFLFMLRAGFDAFEVVKPADAVAFEEASRRYSVFFQPAADGRITVARARLQRASSARQAVERAVSARGVRRHSAPAGAGMAASPSMIHVRGPRERG